MNRTIKVTSLIIIVFFAGSGCALERFSRADVYAKPVIKAIEKYKKDFGEYPKDIRTLVPEYIDKKMLTHVYYRLIYEPSDLTYQYMVKTGELKAGEVQYRISVFIIGSSVNCQYINGERGKCVWLGLGL